MREVRLWLTGDSASACSLAFFASFSESAALSLPDELMDSNDVTSSPPLSSVNRSVPLLDPSKCASECGEATRSGELRSLSDRVDLRKVPLPPEATRIGEAVPKPELPLRLRRGLTRRRGREGLTAGETDTDCSGRVRGLPVVRRERVREVPLAASLELRERTASGYFG